MVLHNPSASVQEIAPNLGHHIARAQKLLGDIKPPDTAAAILVYQATQYHNVSRRYRRWSFGTLATALAVTATPFLPIPLIAGSMVVTVAACAVLALPLTLLSGKLRATSYRFETSGLEKILAAQSKLRNFQPTPISSRPPRSGGQRAATRRVIHKPSYDNGRNCNER